MKRLYRSEDNRVWAGIAGGLGDYFSVDPVIIRLLLILVTIATAIIPMLIAYIIAIFVVPRQPQNSPAQT